MTENGFEYVDLGLPSGTMWANCNVGATKPEDEGLLFQWGRVDGYKYGDINHKFWYDGNFMMTGYCADMWTSWVHDSNVDISCSIGFSSSGFVAVDYDTISYAFSVRGVFKK